MTKFDDAEVARLREPPKRRRVTVTRAEFVAGLDMETTQVTMPERAVPPKPQPRPVPQEEPEDDQQHP